MNSDKRKECAKCNVVKDFSAFSARKTGKWGLEGRCRVCLKEDNALRYKKNKEEYTKGYRLWYQKNKKVVALKGAKRRKEHTKENSKRNVFDGTLKDCSICHQKKSRHPKYWSKNLQTKDGLYAFCKECRSEIRKNSIKECVGVLRDQAKRRGLDAPESQRVYIEIMTSPCEYCGGFDKSDKVYGKFNGVDRVNNLVGYTHKNCVPCCWWCNTIKLDKSVKDVFEHITRMLWYKRVKEGLMDSLGLRGKALGDMMFKLTQMLVDGDIAVESNFVAIAANVIAKEKKGV